jgi:hypothetical protein
MPGPNGVIMAKGNFKLSDTCDKEFNKITQSFSMTAEYARRKGDIDHNVLLDVGQSLPDQAFNATQDSKKVWVHPTNPKKTTSIACDHTFAYESVLVEFHRERQEMVSNSVQQTCHLFLGNLPSMH